MINITVEQLITSHEAVGHEKYSADLLRWLVAIGHFTMGQELPINYNTEIPCELEGQFRANQKYDILVFGSKVWLIEGAVSLERAKYICSLPETQGENWFAGYAVHGQYKNIEKGKPFNNTLQKNL